MSSALLSVHCEIEAGDFRVRADCDIAPGITAFFGPSGSGKSLTLSAIAGLVRPAVGTITFGDNVFADAATKTHLATQERHIGMVFQHGALLPHRSPLDNVALAVRGESSRNRRRAIASQFLHDVDAQHLAHAETATLSGGEQQRISLARALAGSPRIVLLDEPFSALDVATRDSFRRLLRDAVTQHCLTAILVTHDVDDVTSIADRVITFQPGATQSVHDLSADPHGTMRRILGLSS